MNRREQQAADERARRRAVELGEANDPAGVDELLRLASHRRALVRRAAASALGKLAECAPPVPAAQRAAVVARLCELTRDVHPQVRQYAILALGKIGDATALPALRDAAHRPDEPEYNLRAALKTIDRIEAADRARRTFAPVACSRCGQAVSETEREMSDRQFQRVYCDACFNAVFIERRNFDMKVQNQKTILAEDRTVVQSQGERRIADWLTAHGLAYRYDDKFQIIQGYAIRPDFYLPALDVYIEYWGLDTTDYKIGMLLKQKLYQQQGKRLISLHPKDLGRLDDALTAALGALGRSSPEKPLDYER